MKKTLCILLALLMLLTLAACGTAEAPTPAPAPEPAAEPANDPAPADEPAPVDEPAPADRPWVIGFNNFQDSHEFCAKVSGGIRDAAAEYGVELLYMEAAMDGQKMIANTQSFIDQGADLIIDFNWIPEIGATMLAMCEAAGVKLISMDTIYEGTWYFGANGYIAGQKAGEYLAPLIEEQWDGQVDAFVGIYYMGGGVISSERVTGALEALQASGVDFPDEDNVYFFDAGASDQTMNAMQLVRDFLTANPDLRHIVFSTHNDEVGLGVFSGIEAAGRQEHALVVSTGGDTPYHEAVRRGAGDVWVASTAFAPETYGAQVIPMAIAILEGQDVPMEVYLEHFVITPFNLEELYPLS